MIIEARTITNVAEMLEFCLAAVARTYVEPAAICLHVAQEMRVAEITLKDGSRAYDVLIAERRLNRHMRTQGVSGKPRASVNGTPSTRSAAPVRLRDPRRNFGSEYCGRSFP